MISVLKGALYEEVLRIEPLVEGIDRGILILGVDLLDEADPHRPPLADEVAVHGGDALEHLIDVAVRRGGFKLLDGMIPVRGLAQPELVLGAMADEEGFQGRG